MNWCCIFIKTSGLNHFLNIFSRLVIIEMADGEKRTKETPTPKFLLPDLNAEHMSYS